ncbi:DNA polymerase III subunit delta [Pelagibacterales bacterium SAG-MED23]|nr:DNA polymerase III subunit delta [Pelagibacterales bacterium SAG-MED23]
MIIKSFEIDKLKSSNLCLHLIYGNNEGIKKDIIDIVYLKEFKGEILKYDEQDIFINEEEFLSTLTNKSLFENEKLIIISRVSDKIIKLIEGIIEINLLGIKIVLKATSLEKKSKLRSLFEKDTSAICTPVYEDDSRSLNSVIQYFLRENKLRLSQEIINILIERSRGDRSNLMNELLKIKHLSLSKNKLSIEDVNKLSNLAENYSVFELSDNYLAKNSKKVSNILNENNYSSEDCILIIRTILNKCKRLLKIRNEIDNDTSIDQVISSFKPPIFWKEKDMVKKQAQSWSTDEVKEIIFKINDLEALVKKNASNSVLFVSNFVSNYQ